jgi:predicted 2-oxoglutarate/Fe(II)-dependent dioxygenase YbiX
MPPVSFFGSFGLLAVPSFLERDLCAEIRREMATAGEVAATVRATDRSYAVDQQSRRTNKTEVSDRTSSLVCERLMALRSDVEQVFGIEVSGVQQPQFLRYREGDFFAAHQDRASDGKGAPFERQRQVSAVIFLNDETSEPRPDTYEGGSLTLFDLLDSDDDRNVGLPVSGEAGALIGFPSEMLHEVTPITRGERFTVVSWFY